MLTSSELLAIEEGICINCSGDDVECLENCTIHRCVDCDHTTRIISLDITTNNECIN